MSLLVDTDVIIRGERGTFDLPAWLEVQADKGPCLAAITVAELWHGVHRATIAHRQRRESYLQMIVEGLPILPYGEATALEHARILAELESSGNMIGYYDLVVAATALEHKSTLATFNERHFSKIRGVRLIRPK